MNFSTLRRFMVRNINFSAFQILSFLVVVAVACVPLKGQAEAAAEGKLPVRFGAMAIFTGDAGFTGAICRNGMELAREDINEKGGVTGLPLEIVYEDFGPFDMKKAAAAAQKLIAIDRVAALIPFWTEDTEIAAPMAERAGIPLMASWPGGINISKLGRNVFRATTTDTVLLKRLIGYAASLNKKRLCMLHADSAYFENIAEAAPAVARPFGVEFETMRFPGDLDDFRTIALKLKQQGCDAIMTIVPHKSLVPLVRAVQQIRYKPLLLGPSYLDYEAAQKALGDAGDFVFARYLISNPTFAARYKERYREEAQRPAGNCYDAVSVLAYAMNRAGRDYAAINRALHEVKNFPGVTGPFTILPDNDRIGETVDLFRLSKGGVVPVQW